MSPETKLTLAFLTLLAAGLSLVAYGAGLLSTKLGALITGVVIVGTALRLLAMVWRGR